MSDSQELKHTELEELIREADKFPHQNVMALTDQEQEMFYKLMQEGLGIRYAIACVYLEIKSKDEIEDYITNLKLTNKIL